MTREEYIKDLVSQNITGREIVELASQFENEEEEEVKTDDVVAQDATVTSENQEASESLDGKLLLDQEEANAAAKAELKEKKEKAFEAYNEKDEKGILGLFGEGKFIEGGSRFVGEFVEKAVDFMPISGLFDETISSIVTNFAKKEGAESGAYGEDYDFAEETGDLVESGILNIAAGISATPKLIADTKKVIGDGIGEILPSAITDIVNQPSMKILKNAINPVGGLLDQISQKNIVDAGIIAYDNFSEKAEELNLSLMDFGDDSMSGQLGEAFVKYKKDKEGEFVLDENGEKIAVDQSFDERLGSFVTGASRITSSALGSLPSVAQSMIPYVGIASIVAAEAARSNMESEKDNRPLDYQRILHSYVIGASEGLLELTTKKIGGNMFKSLKGNSKEVIEKTLGQYALNVMKDFGKEGLSETATLLINQAADYIYKDEVKEFFPKWGEIMDTFLIGGVMGGGMTSVGSGASILRSYINYKDIKNNLKGTEFKSLSGMFDPNSNLDVDTTTDGEALTETETELDQTKEQAEKTVPSKKSKTLEESSKIEDEVAFMDKQLEKDAVRKDKNQIISKTSDTKLTADQIADNQNNILLNPQTEIFLNTELKRKVESGQMTTDKAEQIKSNFKTKQGVANSISKLGFTGQSRQSIIDLNTELFDINKKIKNAPKSLTKPEQDRIKEIESELASIPRSSAQQSNINKKVDQEVELAKKYGKGKVKSFESTAEFMKTTGVTDPNVDAYIDPDTGEIFINKQKMREAGAVGVGRHELLHKILKSEFQGENGKQLAKEFLDILEKEDPAGYKLLIDRIKQVDPSTGERIYTDDYLETNPDEYLAIFSSLIAEGEITQESIVENPSLIKRLSDFISKIIAKAANKNTTGQDVKPSNISFKNGQDLYDFIKSYNKNAESGVISDRAQQLLDKGENIVSKDKITSKTLTPLEAINKLVPKNITTKKKFDKWVRSESEGGKIIADSLKPGGVISNYIRSRGTRQESDKMLDDILFRIYKFNPEAKRKDGTTVGPEAFGERIFADSAWAKVTARKELFEESERKKQEKSIDSGTMEIANESVISKKDDTNLAKKPTETTKFNKDYLSEDFKNSNDTSKKAIENKINETIVEGYKDRDVTSFRDAGSPKFPIPRSVAQFYADMFGIKTVDGLTKKSQNFYPRDRDGLRNLQKFLIENALSDFNRLPKTVSDTGKSTGILSTKLGKVMYNDNGDLVGSIKQYRDIIQGKPITLTIQNGKNKGEPIKFNPPTKDISRGDLQQNLKTALDFHIKNRVLEVKIPEQGKRLQGGAKFSKTITTEQNEVLSKIGAARNKQQARKAAGIKNTVINNDNRVKMQKEFQDAIDTGKISTETFDAAKLGNSGAKRSRLANDDVVYDLSNGQTIPGVLKESETGERLFDPPTAKQVEAFAGKGVTLVAENNRLYYGVKDPAYIKAKAATKPMSDLKAIRVNVKNAFTETGQDQAKQNQDILYNVSKELEAAVKSKDISPEMMATIIEGAYQATTGLIKISYPFVGKSVKGEYALTGKLNQRTGQSKFREEHNPPASTTGGSLIYAIKQGIVDLVFPGIRKNTGQILLSKIDDRKIDIAKKDSTMDEGKTIMDDQITRITESDININTIINPLTNQTFAEQNNVKVPKEFYFYPDVVSLQKKLVAEQQRSENPLSAKKAQARINVYVKSLAKLKNKASKTLTNQFSPKLSKNATTEQKIETLNNYDKTLKFSRSLNTKPKGISVFDFDDTLAKTNSKVIVTMPESVQSVTNTGDAKKVINTVYKSVINYIANNNDINTISFSSEFSEKSRVKLYNSLASKLSKDLGWELDVFETVDSTGNTDVVTSEDFTLTKGKDAKKIKGDKNAIKFKKDVADNLKSSFDINGKTYDVSLDFRGEGDYSLEFSLRGESKGKTYKINATEFAEQSTDLEAQGAEFNFDEFSKVIDGKKGPLADLALKRQGKFGNQNIFVLTARPQLAAEGIKAFLDGIGLNLPLKNITGLEDGSPQAKANWIISKTAEGYNDFYFADDAIKNVKAVKEILDQVDVKSKVQQAKYSKSITFDKVINNILEDSTGIKSEAEFSKARAQTVGAKKNKFTFFNTPSAEDFVGLIYKFLGKGKVGDAQFQFFQDNLIDPYNRAELAVTRAKITAANDFKALKKSLKTLPKSLSKQTGIGGFTFGQAARVAVWTRQGMEVPGLSKRDAKELNAFVDNNAELDVFVDELINIQKGKPYPAPSQTWLAGNITSDIVNEINKVNRKEYMQEFNENVDIIFSDKVMNKLEAAYGSKYVEALRDTLRRMKSGSNRPVGSSRVVDELLNWLNNSVGAIMFLNTRSAVLQTISAVNFINFGNNNLIAAGRALLNQKQYWKDFMTLMNSPYLVERRDGLKINVSESEIADAVSESSNKPKAFLNLLLSKGFILTRIADSFAIAAGGSTFYRNQIKAYMKSGMDQKAAEKQAFDDFYAIAETSQQSSNPSKISQQQASGAGRVILAFANTPMQYARIIKRATQDLVNGRGDWKTNVSKIVYYSTIQNLIFNALSNALFALAFNEEDEEKEDKTGRIANGMADSLLRGLGIRGTAVAAIKDALITIYEQENKEKGAPELRKAIADLFGFSPPIDSKVRKLTSGLNTLSWEREKMSQEGFNLNNPAYLAFAQILAGLTNVPLDRAITKINNLRAATSDSSAKWQKVALLMGWSAWDLGLPYYGVEDKVEMTPQMILKQKVDVMKKETNTKEQKETLLKLGLTKQQIKALRYEDARVKKIIELQNK